MLPTRRTFLATCGGALTALSGCLSADPPSTAGAWPRRTIDNAHTGHVPTNGPTEEFHEVWRQQRPGNTLPTSPVVGDDSVFLMYAREPIADELGGAWLEAFDAGTGESLWTTELFRSEESGLSHTDSLVLHGDRVFVQTAAGLKVVSTDGTTRWTFPNVGSRQIRSVCPPIVTDELVVIGTYGSTDESPETVFGVDPADGTEKWRMEFPDLEDMGSLAAADGAVYIPFLDESLVALDVESGEELWRNPVPSYGIPTVANETLVTGLRVNGTDVIAAFDAMTGDERWRDEISSRWYQSGFSVAGGRVYSITRASLEARRLDTGERLWTFGGHDVQSRYLTRQTTPVIAGDAIYVHGADISGETTARLFVVDQETGEELGTYTIENSGSTSSVPAVTEGLIFTNQNGELMALGTCGVELAGRCLRY